MWQGYFSWHNRETGTRIHDNPASDGEEWFATALFFAAGRWGGHGGIYDYRAEADAILNTMLHTIDMGPLGSRIRGPAGGGSPVLAPSRRDEPRVLRQDLPPHYRPPLSFSTELYCW